MTTDGDSPGPQALRGRVTGRVQGVFYRASAAEQARRLGLRGWVRNEPDGAVTLLAQGAPEQLDAFRAWLAKGPPAARVDAVAVEPVAVDPALDDFEIRR